MNSEVSLESFVQFVECHMEDVQFNGSRTNGLNSSVESHSMGQRIIFSSVFGFLLTLAHMFPGFVIVASFGVKKIYIWLIYLRVRIGC